ncbi:cation:dicarboxylase symporter family transporter [Peribacillus frigoritolerans]|uniref:dicarboxylate/amino acid:cation symporter n=1 Tax=Peribacillus frigoritolerans TaxID=450367 RepID=UPI0021CE87F3|nr:cation:dicarboxylase symporter family transporter [Peribacillus frigoritolerans]MCU6600272.1 cation:dicarboxylase symporter family transporter [Peribacillus frigoritolerans]
MQALRRIPLWLQISIALVLGLCLGSISKTIGIEAKILGDAFIHMIKMTIVPLIFPLIILGIAQIKSTGSLGRLSLKAIIYFEIVTTLIIVMSLLLANMVDLGVGADLSGGNMKALEGLEANKIDFREFILHIIPSNIFVAFSEGNILAIVYFGVFFGLALRSLKGKAKPIEDVLEALSKVMFKVLDYVIKFSPLGVFGSIAYSMATYGFEKLSTLLDLILVTYAGLAIVLLIIFPIIARIYNIRYWELINEIKDLLLIAFTTRSSESVFAPLTARLEGYGVKNSVVSFVLPLGYSFNLDGGMVYMAPAILFLANAYEIQLSLLDQVHIILLLMLLTKGVASVPSGVIVVLTSVSVVIGLPMEGIALLMAVDFIMDMARTATNVVGNALATVVIAKSEGMFHKKEFEVAEHEKIRSS